MFNYNKKIIATVTYKSEQKSVQINRTTIIKQLKAKFEVKCNFNLGKFKLVHQQSGSDLMLVNDNLNVIEHFGEEGLDNLLFEIVPKEFTDMYYIQMFEKEYFRKEEDEKKNVLPDINANSKINPNLSGAENKKSNNINTSISNINNVKDDNKQDICFWDKLNRSTFICTKCRQEYCRECIKYEPHPQNLLEKAMVDSYCKVSRENFKKELTEKIINNQYYNGLSRIDFILNDKVKQLDDQFDEIFQVLARIKETQTKFLMDLYYQQVENKKFKDLPYDLDYFNGKYKQIESTYKPGNAFINENLDNLKTLEKYQKLILQSYDDFQFKYGNFNNMFKLYENFNSVLLNQVESKLKASNDLRKQINNPKDLEKEELYANNKKMKPQQSFVNILKISYYNSISVFNNVKMSIKKNFDFEDKCDFRLNYQLYDGNIFLNWEKKLFIVTGSKFNKIFMYDFNQNKMFKFGDLKDNHCRGSMLLVDYRVNDTTTKKFILVAGGRMNGTCEILDTSDLVFSKIPIVKEEPLNNQNKSLGADNAVDPQKTQTSKFSGFFKKKNNEIPNVGLPFEGENKQVTFKEPNKENLSDYSKTVWSSFPTLNTERNQFGMYFQNNRFIYAFFGINSRKGNVNTVERIDFESHMKSFVTEKKEIFKSSKKLETIPETKDTNLNVKWEIIHFKNPKNITIGLHSFGICFLNPDEILLIGGILRDETNSNKMFKYNMTHEAIYLSPHNIPDLDVNEYYRFWEESNFLSLKDLSGNYNTNDDFYYGMYDAKNKVHLLNIKTLEYRIINN